MGSTIRHISTLSTPPADVASAGLSPVQAQVVRALASGRSVSAAAREAELHRATIHNWLKTSTAFAAAVRQARLDSQNELSDQLFDLSAAALETLRGLLSSPETPPAVRLRAALAVLERPASPEAAWNLPVPVAISPNKPTFAGSPPADALEDAQNKPNPAPIPRSVPCPCGSGRKDKHCCGPNAPPVLSDLSSAA